MTEHPDTSDKMLINSAKQCYTDALRPLYENYCSCKTFQSHQEE